MKIWLAEITAYNPSTLNEITLRFCSGLGFVTGPTETPADTLYIPRITQPALLRRNIPIPGADITSTKLSYGELVLANTDGGLDYLTQLDFSGRSITLRCGVGPLYPADFPIELVAVVDDVKINMSEVSVKIKSPRINWDQPITTAVYGGTNSGGAGIDGDANLKGTLKPVCFGAVYLMSPVLVNSSKLIYQYHTPGIIAPTVNYMEPFLKYAFEGGTLMASGAGYTSQADMEANAPAAGSFRVWYGGGCIRLGSSPSKKLAVSVASGSHCCFWYLLEALIRGPGGVVDNGFGISQVSTSGFYNDSIVTDDSIASYGLVLQQGDTLSGVIDRLCHSAGYWWGFRKSGMFCVGEYISDDSIAATLTADRIKSFDRNTAPMYWRVTMNCQKNNAVHSDSDFAGTTTLEERQYMSREWTQGFRQDVNIQTRHLSSQELVIDSLSRWPLFFDTSPIGIWLRMAGGQGGTTREVLTVTVILGTAELSIIDIGSKITVQMPRLGYTTGKDFIVCGIQTDQAKGIADLTLWG